jgi:hypothetical protein
MWHPPTAAKPQLGRRVGRAHAQHTLCMLWLCAPDTFSHRSFMNSRYTPGRISLNLPSTACLITSITASEKKIWQHCTQAQEHGEREEVGRDGGVSTGSQQAQ